MCDTGSHQGGSSVTLIHTKDHEIWIIVILSATTAMYVPGMVKKDGGTTEAGFALVRKETYTKWTNKNDMTTN